MTKLTISDADYAALELAVELLESEAWYIKMASLIGTPIENGIRKLPQKIQDAVGGATNKALNTAAVLALHLFGEKNKQNSSDLLHKAAVMLTGAAGGTFGIYGALIEMPVTTTLMLRSIADIARSEGEDILSSSAALECVNVFAFGGPSEDDDAAESSYFSVRLGLAEATRDLAKYLATKAGAKKSTEYAARLAIYLTTISTRYGPMVAEKLTFEAAPIIGGLTGAVINLGFMSHFQDKARGHFLVRRLEREYGEELVHEKYNEIREARLTKSREGRKTAGK